VRILVTGGTGFIGRSLIPLFLERGHDILVLTHSRQPGNRYGSNSIKYFYVDLQDAVSLETCMKKFKPQALVHLAWEGLPDYSMEMCRRNLEYSIRLFSLASMLGCSPILSTGSCWEYAGNRGMLSENDELESAALFPATKTAIRFIGESIARENGLRFYWLRLFYVYGPGQRKTSLIPHIIESAKNGSKPQIQSPCDRNDFIFVDDVARAITGVIEHQPDKVVYNVGSGNPTAVEEVVRITYETMNKTFDNKFLTKREAGTGKEFWADISRICKDIGWQSEWDIQSGVRATIKHMGIDN